METAVVGIVGALIGILLSNALRLYFDWRDRRERVRDLQTALRAEIRGHRHALEYFDQRGMDEIIQRMERDATYSPLVTREIEPPIFAAVVGSIHLLPGDVIDPVVLFYRQTKILGALAEDMRDASFRSLALDLRVQMIRDYFALGAYALDLADIALAALSPPVGGAEMR